MTLDLPSAVMLTADDGRSVAAVAGAADGSLDLRIFDARSAPRTPAHSVRLDSTTMGAVHAVAWSEARLVATAGGGTVYLARLSDGAVIASLALDASIPVGRVWLRGGRGWAELPAGDGGTVLVQLRVTDDSMAEVGRVSIAHRPTSLYDNGEDRMAASTSDGVTVVAAGCR